MSIPGEPPSNRIERNIRDLYIYALRLEGATYPTLSGIFGISQTSIKFILHRVARKLHRQSRIRPMGPCPAYWARLQQAGAIPTTGDSHHDYDFDLWTKPDKKTS